MSVELNVIEDVRDFIVDELGENNFSGLGTICGCDLYSYVFEAPNANGSLDYNRTESFNYLELNHNAEAWVIHHMVNELGILDYDDLYGWGTYEEVEEEGSTPYIEEHAEEIKVVLFISIGQVILEMCPTVREYWNHGLDLGDEEIYTTIVDEVENINIQRVADWLD